MSHLEDQSNRRGFLGKIAAGAATLGVSTLADPFRLAASVPRTVSAADAASFEAWLGRIKGSHKQVFDSMMHDNGFAFAWSRIFLMTNKAVGVADGDATAVLVLRHESILLGMEDRLWAKYNFGKMFKLDDPATKKPSVRNMFWKPKPNDLPLPGMGLNELLDSGVLVGICDMALTFYSKHLAASMKKDADEIKKDWVSGVFPGIEIVPSGVLAVNRAQEHGCTYCWAG